MAGGERRNFMKRALWLPVVVSLLLFGACAEDDPAIDAGDDTTSTSEESSEIEKVAVTAKDFAFELPAEIEAGTVEFTMDNAGREPHHASLQKIAEGKTAEDVQKAFSQPPGPSSGPPPVTELAGMATADAGKTSNMIVEIEPGNYIFTCFIPSPDGKSHLAKGMIQAFTVKAGGEAAPLPAADATVTMKDFSYDAFKLNVGKNEVSLDNQGLQFHEANLVEFAPGKGMADLAEWSKGPSGPPPFSYLGGTAVVSGKPGVWRTPELEKGKSYALVCFIPDRADDVPHLAKGMAAPFTVE